MNHVVSYGERAFLVTPGEGSPLGVAAALVARRPAGVVDVVPAAATVLVTLRTRMTDAELDRTAVLLRELPAHPIEPIGRPVTIDVDYRGEDLDAVADASGLTAAEVVGRHTGAQYRSEFCGFAPGFAYLSGLDPALELPRRFTPRTSVPAGAVAIAGRYSAVYPSASPGGWHLLGHTDVRLWDPSATPPALLAPGTTVRFQAADLTGARRPSPEPTRRWADPDHPTLEVLEAGLVSSVQDRGRPGLAHLGVPSSGALDQAGRALVNRMVGNVGDAAVIETTGGLVLRALAPVVVADSATGAVTTVAAGTSIRVDPFPAELWVTLAVRGAIVNDPVLGSRSWDSLSGFGPGPLCIGDRLAIGPDPRTPMGAELVPRRPATSSVRVDPGPRRDWFRDDAWESLVSTEWTISGQTSRVGVRLDGPALTRAANHEHEELASEGLVLGAVQVPPDGRPIVMLADHPTTGGYPVIAVVDTRDLDSLVRRRPGSALRFRHR